MKKIKKTIKELLILFSEFETKAIDEIKKTQKVLKSLYELRRAKIEKIHFHEDLSQSYSELRSKISLGL